MQVHQVVVRPHGDQVIILYVDQLGQRFNMSLEMGDFPAAAELVRQCQARLPPDAEHPAKDEIETEIRELERRLARLKESIGQPV